MKSVIAGLVFVALSIWATSSVAQRQPNYPVDPQTKWAVGAKQKPADELKKQLDSGSKVLLIDVRTAARFEKETIPGAINVPLDQLEEHLKAVPKDRTLVFT